MIVHQAQTNKEGLCVENKICIDLFTDRVLPWMKSYPFKKVDGPRGLYYTIEVSPQQKKDVLKRVARSHIRCRWYEKRWARSSGYRESFFRENPPPYRCRYCGRKLSKDRLVVDHVVPVAQAKKSKVARYLLTRRGIQNVNDTRNLAPSCFKCNRRKSDKLGIWYIRGRFGGSRLFLAVYHVFIFGLVAIAILALLQTNLFSIIGAF